MADTPDRRPAPPARTYLRLIWTWSRAMAQYPLSLAFLGLAQSLSVTIELIAVLTVFGHARTLAGFTATEALLVYGLAGTAFGTADLLIGQVERLGAHIRSGAFDTMLIRPVSPLVQLAADEFSPRRLGKLLPALACLAYALATADIDWTPARALTLPLLIASGAAICCATWLIGACLQFFIAEAREAANSITYGGKALTEYPLAVFGTDTARWATFALPLAFVSWQPALHLLDRPDPTGLPEQLRHAAPAAALLLTALAALAWRTGLRHYRSTGS
ncbi:ABC transporter permease [Nocardiopsis potens]|uniref:ABC transporter permease n=1 Tax=Nocardiopsis potens TaxID=1246458 RepID=UPI000372EB6F